MDGEWANDVLSFICEYRKPYNSAESMSHQLNRKSKTICTQIRIAIR